MSESDYQGFDGNVAEELKAFVMQRKKDMPEDQRHRYPINTKGQPWKDALFSFEPHSFLLDVKKLRDDVTRISIHF